MQTTPFEFIEDVEKRVREDLVNPPEGIAMIWWQRFNQLLGGLRMHELTVLSAPTGAGKTTLTANIVCQGILAGIGSYICSAEIGNSLFLQAMYSAFDQSDYVSGEKWTADKVDQMITKYRTVMRSSRLIFSRNDDRIAPKTLIQEIERAHSEFGTKLVILDNLQFFMPIVGGDKQLAATDEAVRDFVRFIRKTPVHALLIAHPKKTSDNRVDSETSVKGSSTIYQECSNFIGFNRLPDEALENGGFTKFDRQLKFFKIRRRGANVGESVYFTFDRNRYNEKRVQFQKGYSA